MKTAYSDVDYAKKVAALQAQALHINPPAIPFRKASSTGAEKKQEHTKMMKVKIDPTDEESDSLDVKVTIFEVGDAEEWVRWRIQFEELVRDVPLKDALQKTKVAKALLRGQAKEFFDTALSTLIINSSDEDDEEIFQAAVEQLGRHYFPSNHAWRRQRNYLRYHLFMADMTLLEFKQRLLEMNKFLNYFPIPDDREEVEALPQDELVEILDRAKRVEWQRDLLTANIDPYGMSLEEYCKYLEKLEVKHRIDKALRKDHQVKAKAKSMERKPDKGRPGKPAKKPCRHCGKVHKAPDSECWTLDKSKDPRQKRKFKPTTGNERLFSAEQMESVMEALRRKAKKPPKQRKVEYEPATFKMDNTTSEDDSNYSVSQLATKICFQTSKKAPHHKKGKKEHLTTEVVAEIRNDRGETWPLRTLIDTGTSSSIILSAFTFRERVHVYIPKRKSPSSGRRWEEDSQPGERP